MPAYHDIDGESCHASRHLLTEVLREEWGFDGLVVADYIGISLLYQHHNLAKDPAEAAAMAFGAGLDIELPADDCTSHLGEAVERGLIIDRDHRRDRPADPHGEAPPRPLRAALRGRGGDRAAGAGHPRAGPRGRRARRSSCWRIAASCRSTRSSGRRIAVIGPTADDPLALLCGYNFPVHLILNDAGESASQVVTPRAAFEKAFGAGRVAHAKGCYIVEVRKYGSPVFPGDVEKSTTLEQTSPVSEKVDLIPEAVACAEGGGRRGRVRRRPGRPLPDRHRGRGIRCRLARPAGRPAAAARGRRRDREARGGRADERPPVQPGRAGGQGGCAS